MATPDNIQLGSLDFVSIKNSIIDHLKSQDTLKDYDYTGSVVQVLLDILAYNTLYYGFYTNMIANEMFLDTAQKMESLISLVKPLGFVVPGKVSAKSTIKLTNGTCVNSRFVPKYSRFTGNDGLGVAYNFYNIESFYLDNNCESVITVVEGKNLFKEMTLAVDPQTKKGFIEGLDVDTTTIVVEVYNTDQMTNIRGEEVDVGWEIWSRATNIESGLDQTSKIFWLERSEYGFFIVFGGAYGDAVFTQVGKRLTNNDRVRISYLKSSGTRGNGVSGFSWEGTQTITTLAISSGGEEEPNLEAIRFFAPKWFASQDRAVTKEDCRSLLVEAGFVGDADDPYSKFNVWGGEEMDPPRYGRVFVSLSENYDSDFTAPADAIAILEKKTCVSILPEYMSSFDYGFRCVGNVSYDPIQTNLSEEVLSGIINERIKDHYPNMFDSEISISSLVNQINLIDSSLNANTNDISLTISKKIDPTNTMPVLHEFKNPLIAGSLSSDEFVAHSSLDVDVPMGDSRLIRLRVRDTLVGDEYQVIVAYYYWNNQVDTVVAIAGKYYPLSGKVILNPNISSEEFDIHVVPEQAKFKAKENMFLKLQSLDINLVAV